MIINFKVDGKYYNLNVNSDKALNKILMDDLGNTSLNSQCHNASCGNCIVLINSQAALSCLVPAFKLNDTVIQTFEHYQKTRLYRDIQKAYSEVERTPCPRCFAAKTLIIESILQSLLKNDSQKYKNIEEKDKEFINKELSLNSCHCIETQELIRIVEKALDYRGRRRVRKS